MEIRENFKSLIPPLTPDEYRQLEENILSDGIRDPLVLWGDILIDGHNRYEIAKKHGLTFQTVQRGFDSEDAAALWIIDNQFGRRNLPETDRMILAQKKSGIFSAMAKARQSAAGKQYGAGMQKEEIAVVKNNKSYSPIDLPQPATAPAVKPTTQKPETPATVKKELTAPKPPLHTRAEVAKMAGVSESKLAQFEQIQKKKPEMVDEIRKGNTTIGKVYGDIRREVKAAAQETRREENAVKIEKLSTPLEAQGLFQTIVIDPPWDWGDEGDVNQFGRAKPEYHTMPIDEIAAMPIPKISDENCHLYLWVTNRSLPKAFRLIDAWGFRYITCLTWVKPSIGMGNYFRGSTEQVLFAVKGSQPLKRRDVGTHFQAPRGDKHSAKPDEFYKLVESCSYGPYIDIFGRKGREGWSVWGENG